MVPLLEYLFCGPGVVFGGGQTATVASVYHHDGALYSLFSSFFFCILVVSGNFVDIDAAVM
jgi:hypothetical protein